ncbi:hypothetical protein, partial [Facklamia sp. P12955]|uniref:hypothetical protein n=1 Tax=Facklamia sp. P12955 TaxID=3421946 RepID=UPI003D179422
MPFPAPGDLPVLGTEPGRQTLYRLSHQGSPITGEFIRNEGTYCSPVVKTLPSNAGGGDLITDWGAKMPHALQTRDQNINRKQHCDKFNKDFKNGP